ncbi:DUF2510 domain-containing protein [Arthrobacter sp. PAMC25284]|uniref:DUF2510 domain-containing protein n=1 Tax=Arthrobacter sp. PAMC25284 TaxID=2861279 RepID=UPI0035C0670D
MPKCRACGHQRSLHRAESAGPAPTVQQAPATQTPAQPVGPPPGFYKDPQNPSASRWWDGHQWTDIYQ